MPLEQGRDSRRIGGWSSYTKLLKSMDKGGLGKVRLGLGEMLLCLMTISGEDLSLLECTQILGFFLIRIIR